MHILYQKYFPEKKGNIKKLQFEINEENSNAQVCHSLSKHMYTSSFHSGGSTQDQIFSFNVENQDPKLMLDLDISKITSHVQRNILKVIFRRIQQHNYHYSFYC